jgi:hypothetical protein
MTDFYAQLEDQLVAAGRRRQTQGRVGRAVAGRGRAVLGATVVAVAVAAGVAVALPGALSGTSERAPAVQPQVTPAPATTPPPATTTPHAVVPVPSPSLAGIRVAILNGTTRPGLARAVADWLRRRHATVVSVAGNASQDTAQTVVIYRSDSRAKARRVAAALGGVPVRASGASPDGRVTAVIVLVGADYRRPPVPAVPQAPAAVPPVATPPPVPIAPGRTAPAAVPVPSARGGYVPAPTATVPLPAATPAAPATPIVPPAARPVVPSAPAP